MSSIRNLATAARDPQAQLILLAIDAEFDRFDELLGRLQRDVAGLAAGGRVHRRIYRRHMHDPDFEAQLEAYLGSPG